MALVKRKIRQISMASSYSAYKCGSREGGHVSLARQMYSQACSYLASDYLICYLFKKLKRVFAPFEFET